MNFSIDSTQKKVLAVTVQYCVPFGDIIVYEMNVKKLRLVALDLLQLDMQTVVRKFGHHIEVDSRLGKLSSKVKLRFK